MSNRKALTNHNFDYGAEDEKTESGQNSLKRLVDVTGIEPVTPCLQSGKLVSNGSLYSL
jgi:hypothetical protein